MNPYLLIDIKQVYWFLVTSPNLKYLQYLMNKLSHRSQVVCVLEACKMVFPIWEEYASKSTRLTKEQKEDPKKTIETIEKWLEGKASKYEVDDVSMNIRINVSSGVDYAAEAVSDAAGVVFADDEDTAAYAAMAIIGSANAYYYADVRNVNFDNTKLLFLRKWLDICYPLIHEELQDKYNILIKNIVDGDI